MKKVKIRSTSGEYVLAIRLPSEYNYNSSPRSRPRDKENNPVVALRENETKSINSRGEMIPSEIKTIEKLSGVSVKMSRNDRDRELISHVIYCSCMRLKEKEALAYLKDKGHNISTGNILQSKERNRKHN